MTIESTLIDMQMHITAQDKDIEDLNQEVIRLSKIVNQLANNQKILLQSAKESIVKPLADETPPPHY